MKKKLVGVGLLLFVFSFFNISKVNAWPGVYSSWGYEQVITLTASTPVDDYQVGIFLHVTNFNYPDANADGSDIRFADNSDNLLSYWIEKWNDHGDSKIWVKVTHSGTSQIKMYYSNSVATSESNGDNVFEFFDDFSGGSLDGYKWMTSLVGVGSSVTQSGGMVDCYVPKVTGAISQLSSNTSNGLTYGPNTVMEGRASLDFSPYASYGSFGYGSSVSGGHYINFTDHTDFLNDTTVEMTSHVASSYMAGYQPGDVNVWHNYKIIREDHKATWFRDGTQLTSYADSSNVANDANSLNFGGVTYNGGGVVPSSAVHHYLDWVFVRKYNGVEIANIAFAPDARQSWLYNAWAFKNSITLAGPTPAMDYVTAVNLNAGNFDYSKAKADGSDLRFADPGANALDYNLNYWIENWNPGGDSLIWVKIPNQGVTQFEMFYGNNVAASESNGFNTFYFFDDFNGSSLDANRWYLEPSNTGTPTVAGGLLDMFVPMDFHQIELVYTKQDITFDNDTILEGRASIDYGGDATYGEFGFNTGGKQMEFTDGRSTDSNIFTETSKNPTPCESVAAGDINVFHKYRVNRHPGTVEYDLDDSLVGTCSDSNCVWDNNASIIFGGTTYSFGGYIPDSAEHHYLDWVRVLRYSAEVVNYTVGSEESNNTTESLSGSGTVTATVPSSLTFNVAGVSSGTACANSGGNASVTSTSLAIPLGTYAGAQTKIACQTLTVSTNAGSGYIVSLEQNQDLTNASSNTMGKFTGTYTVPTIWSSPISPIKSFFGFTTDDTDLTNFQTNKYAQLAINNTPYTIMQATHSVADEGNVISYQLEVNDLQEAGVYANTLRYIVTGTF